MSIVRLAAAPARAALRSLPAPARRIVKQRVIKTRGGVEPVRNYLIDRRYGGRVGGTIASARADVGAFGYSGADHIYVQRLFSPANGVDIRPHDVLVDVGSGKGRVLNAWLHLGFTTNKLIGVELDPTYAGPAERRLSPFPNVTIVEGDAVGCCPTDATVFFLFNPFNRAVTRAFKERLEELYPPGSDLRIVYYFSLFSDLFDDDPGWVVRPSRVKTFHRAVVIHRAGTP